ncbi:MAG: TerD family protein [Ruminococcus sp.]|jgi:stress response protein SCP2|nr:TerD family protein [Ruminococcus sp.]
MSDLPKILSLGKIPADSVYRAAFEVICDSPCEIKNLPNVKFSPAALKEGLTAVEMTVSPLREGIILYTKTKIGDQDVIITAEAVKSDFSEQNKLIRKAGNPENETPERLYLPKFPGAPAPKMQKNETVLTRGAHIPIPTGRFEALLTFEKDGKTHDIDAYVFMQDGRGIVKNPAEMVYFGNDISPNGAVSYLNAPDKRAVYTDLTKLPPHIGQLDFVYAFYGGGETFSRLRGCNVKITAGGVNVSIPLSENADVIVAFEVTRKGGGYELSPLIMPYKKGIETLCKNYGLKVK